MYIARNSNGVLYLHAEKPHRVTLANKGYWVSNGSKMPITSTKPYPRWQDEPIPVSLQADWINESCK